MTDEEILYTVKFAYETVEDWMSLCPKKVQEDDIKALELLEKLINHLKEKQND